MSIVNSIISIHALREEGDRSRSPVWSTLRRISIHALREEGDLGEPVILFLESEFLSTPSARRATTLRAYSVPQSAFLSTPSARRATFVCHLLILLCIFLSTPSARRATDHRPDLRLRRAISIHALREEGDPSSIKRVQVRYNFYPRPPRGGRPIPPQATGGILIFLSTPSAWRATRASSTATSTCSYFYPRPPRGGRPFIKLPEGETLPEFLSTPSARRATSSCGPASRTSHISIHALREEGDHDLFHSHGFVYEFLSTPSARRATRARSCACRCDTISIHALREEGDHS